ELELYISHAFDVARLRNVELEVVAFAAPAEFIQLGGVVRYLLRQGIANVADFLPARRDIIFGVVEVGADVLDLTVHGAEFSRGFLLDSFGLLSKFVHRLRLRSNLGAESLGALDIFLLQRLSELP